MNLALWRQEDLFHKCISYYKDPENRHLIMLGEQDVLNAICSRKVHVLPVEYNMMQHYYLHSNRYILDKYKPSIAIHRANAIAIHFICAEKPWYKDCTFPLSKYYKEYQSRTPWRDREYGLSSNINTIEFYYRKFKQWLHSSGVIHDPNCFDV